MQKKKKSKHQISPRSLSKQRIPKKLASLESLVSQKLVVENKILIIFHSFYVTF